MKICVFMSASYENKYGYFNAVHSRIKEWRGGHIVSVFNIMYVDSLISSIIRRRDRSRVDNKTLYDGVSYTNIEKEFSIIDYFLSRKLGLLEFVSNFFLRNAIFSMCAESFRDQDFFVAHGVYPSGYLCKILSERYKKPYAVFLHGSDVNYEACRSRFINKFYRDILRKSSCNFYVSDALHNKAVELNISSPNDIVTSNGVQEHLFRNDDFPRSDNKCVSVGFVGGIVDVKNVMLLPAIFNIIKLSEGVDVRFILIGDGYLRNSLELDFKKNNIDVEFWGKLDHQEMHKAYKNIDLLLLPSKNEGLALVLLEAIASGCYCIGSRVGGVPEVLGVDNTIPLDEDFVVNFSSLALQKISDIRVNGRNKARIDSKYRWDIISENEINQMISVVAK